MTTGQAAYGQGTLKVFAASSLTDVFPKIAAEWKKQSGIEVEFSFDSSSRLAKQIAAGAPADLYLTADREWVDFLERQKRTQENSARPFLSNKLVVIVSKNQKSPSTPKIRQAQDLRDPHFKHLAVASEFVPVGKLARAFLQNENIFSDLKSRLVNAPHAKGIIRWVASQQVPAGIAFVTDALAEPKVQVALEIDSSRHPPIEYFGVPLSGRPNELLAKNFLDFCLTSQEAQKLFEKAGFIYLPGRP